MPDYAHLYHTLFNAITLALESMPPHAPATALLKQAQCRTEEEYISCGEDEGDAAGQTE